MTIEEAASKFHWFQIAEDGVVEMFLDHHSLQTFRQCEASFELSMMANIKSKGRSWNLEFGIWYHKMIELFYRGKQHENFNFTEWLAAGVAYWQQMQLEEQFSEHKMYKSLGGWQGALAMISQYADHFAAEVDRLRVIGIEITFGKKKEVPLGVFSNCATGPYENIRCYLTGRIDFLMDSGSSIGPLDHKTTAFFKGIPTASYEPQEGMTGYVYAVREIMKLQFSELLGQRKVDRIWMNFAQITPDADYNKRFRRIPLFKTDWQLEQYRLRQLRTFNKIYDMLILGQTPDWNTAVCNNMFHSECQYRNLHRQNSAANMLNILNQDFIVSEPWNPETLED